MAESPEYIKEGFRRWVEGWGWEKKDRYIYPYNEVVFDVGEQREEWPLPKLLGKLWRCTEPMTDTLCERTDLPRGSSFARAAQAILAAGRKGKYFIPASGYRVPQD